MNAQKSSRAPEEKMGDEDPSMIEDMPEWSFFFAQVNGEIFGFDLRDMAQKYEWRARTGETPVMINPITLKAFHGRTRAKLVQRFEALVNEGLLSNELRPGWAPEPLKS